MLFIKLKASFTFNQDLELKIKKLIRECLSPRHVPSFIFETPAIPYTVNGKKVEIVVKKILSDIGVTANASLSNPECLEFYKKIKESIK